MADADSQADLEQVQIQHTYARSKTLKHRDQLLSHNARLDALETSALENMLEEKMTVEMANLGDQIESLMEEVHSLRDSQMVYHSLIQAGGKSDKSSKIGGYDEDRDNTILDNFFWDVEEYLAS